MSKENKTLDKHENGNDFIADVMGSTPSEKWENLKKYILAQTEKIDKETPWQNTEPEWWLEMQTIERNVRQYCP